MTSNFIPHAIALLRAWLLNFKTKLTVAIGTTVGLTNPETVAGQDKAQEGIDLIDAVAAAESAKVSAVTNLHNWMKANGTGLAVLRALARQIKGNPGATPAIKALLRLLGIHEAIDFLTYKPSGKATSHVGYILIVFEKLGVELMSVEWRIKGDADWNHIGNLKDSNYHHHYILAVGQTAVALEYRLNGVVHDVMIGVPSDLISVNFSG